MAEVTVAVFACRAGLSFSISDFGAFLDCAFQRGGRVSPRRATHLFFASPKKSKQKKGDPTVWVPTLRFGQLAVLELSGGLLKLAALRQSQALIR